MRKNKRDLCFGRAKMNNFSNEVMKTIFVINDYINMGI